MKRIIFIVGLCFFSAAAFAQKTSSKASSAAATGSQIDVQKNAAYNQLMGKDIATVLQAIQITDTTGKTKYQTVSKILTVFAPNGDQLTFKNNKLSGVLYKK